MPDANLRETPLTTGQPAPDFTLPSDVGEDVTLSTLRPKIVVLYFYPKDDTPGCTKQAIGFTEAADAFVAAGAVVLGISKDTVVKHGKFRDKHGLSLALLSDAESNVCEQYGTWTEKSMYGRKFMGIERTTYVIDSAGMIAQAWHKVRVPGHVEQVLKAVQTL